MFLTDTVKNHGCYFGMGSYTNTKHTIERWGGGKQREVVLNKPGSVPLDTWQTARVSVRGRLFECYLDGEGIFKNAVDTHGTGQVGLRTWGTACKFRNIKVTDALTREVLLEGLPDLPEK
jgi:hypothetical protein